ncbi:MAG: hypothetical protein ACYS3S_03570 [Planctomycetota bacterium]
MKNQFDSIRTKVLTVGTAVFLANSIMDCNDSIVADMEAEHRQLGSMVRQELQQCPSAHPPGSKTEALFPAQ